MKVENQATTNRTDALVLGNIVVFVVGPPVKYLKENSERLFGVGKLTEEQVLAKYHPCLKQPKDGYDPLLHTKIRTEEPHQHAVRYWTKKGDLREPPSDWRHARVQLRFRVSHLWIMSSGFGLTVNVLDVLMEEEGGGTVLSARSKKALMPLLT